MQLLYIVHVHNIQCTCMNTCTCILAIRNAAQKVVLPLGCHCSQTVSHLSEATGTRWGDTAATSTRVGAKSLCRWAGPG